ncbi:hypothetical protein MCP_2123 [Methanocella paludicola SANAE]|uniref:Uncharacterized protein n=1 Tax=Methanocella paludicola (strain DSM 17711 / JCM 13418 / NBRC 101707 / SANAE) TaxID=304371 RepID=D1Z0H3_METPS|nr:hypothetical protein [Methanocella paludicola]BAI62195.1 hypothetical protein MCP_2123 [Methanocella paludicola SANAE]
MDVVIITGRRGEAFVSGRVVARIGQWDVRSFPDGGWDGSCECEWYAGSDPGAFGLLKGPGIEVSLRLIDHNETAHEGVAMAAPDGDVKMLGDVALLDLILKGSGPVRHA